MATYSSVLPWEISWTEETGGLQSIESDMSESAHNTTLFKAKFIQADGGGMGMGAEEVSH